MHLVLVRFEKSRQGRHKDNTEACVLLLNAVTSVHFALALQYLRFATMCFRATPARCFAPKWAADALGYSLHDGHTMYQDMLSRAHAHGHAKTETDRHTHKHLDAGLARRPVDIAPLHNLRNIDPGDGAAARAADAEAPEHVV